MLTTTNEAQFLYALSKTLETGSDRITRNGLTRAIFAHQIRFDLKTGFPLLTTKKLFWNSVVAELLWFLDAGKETNGRLSLQKLNELQGKPKDAENIWTMNQADFAKKGKARFPGDCGVIYGSQWRRWETIVPVPETAIGPGVWEGNYKRETIDQLANVIKALKEDPFSRYHLVKAWNPAKISDMCLPPCHMGFQLFVREIEGTKFLDLHMEQRSCDMFLGVPFNIASYALLQHMIAQCVDMTPGELIITLNDCHIYLAAINEDKSLDYDKGHKDAVTLQLSREPYIPPYIHLNKSIKDIDEFTMTDITLVDYKHHPYIKGDLL